MPEPGEWPQANSLLSGLFGVLQAGAQARKSTADVWTGLRVAAATWQFQAQGGGELPPQDQLEAAGRDILARNGIGIQQVNTYRAVAGNWLSSKSRAAQKPPTEQVTARDIFVPPWAKTTSDETPDRYRVRVNWQITPTVGDAFTQWSTYELTSPLTTVGNILDQAADKAAGDKYLTLLSGGAPLTVNDFEIEQV